MILAKDYYILELDIDGTVVKDYNARKETYWLRLTLLKRMALRESKGRPWAIYVRIQRNKICKKRKTPHARHQFTNQ